MRGAHWLTKWISAGLIALMALSCRPGPAQQKPQSPSDPATQEYPDAPAPRAVPPASLDASDSQQDSPRPPLGAAAAPDIKPTGVTGSMLSGAAIAPAKQRRVRIILISLGVIAAAGVALGTVAALSHASPSRAQ
jgi:hypothetical protein